MRQLESEETIAIAVQLTATFMGLPKAGQSKDNYIVQFAKSYLKLIPRSEGGAWDEKTVR